MDNDQERDPEAPRVPVAMATLAFDDEANESRGVRWHYWNAMGLGIYVVASVTADRALSDPEATAMDWAAYIGANPAGAHVEALGWRPVLDYGAKLQEHEARAFFPEFAAIPYRL